MNGCCCCFSLRTGGLILAYLSLISGVTSTFTTSISSGLVTVLVAILCLYGIYKESPSFMLPYIILSWAAIAFCFILIIFIPIDWFGTKWMEQFIIEFYKPATEADKQTLIDALGTIYLVMWIMIAVSIAFGSYFTWVMQSLYKSIKMSLNGTFQQTTAQHGNYAV